MLISSLTLNSDVRRLPTRDCGHGAASRYETAWVYEPVTWCSITDSFPMWSLKLSGRLPSGLKPGQREFVDLVIV